MLEATKTIHGVKPSRLSADERRTRLIRRPWTRAERAVVLMGFFGRLSIAIEPVICSIVFALLTLGIVAAPRLSPRYVHSDIVVIAPVFAVAFLACAFWTLAVMFAPLRALAQTKRPIYIVDGYIRFRRPDERSEDGSNGYVAVLTEDGTVACEWATLGEVTLPEQTRPALCEFSEYGGVHRIDGHLTGVLPTRIPLLGVGIKGRKEEIV